jgi:hypothetical protein
VKVLVYVEGPSDRDALRGLLDPIVTAGRERGVGISFHPLNDKAALLDNCGRKAADHLAEHPDGWVFALPDLYPMSVYDGTRNAHSSFAELERLLRARFLTRAEKIGVPPAVHGRFRVHCLKYDLEGLLLAAPDALRARLGTTDALRNRWRNPVEDQNDRQPPKRIVEVLFSQYRKRSRYVDTVDAPWILQRASLDALMTACPQRFAPFVSELRGLAVGGTP